MCQWWSSDIVDELSGSTYTRPPLSHLVLQSDEKCRAEINFQLCKTVKVRGKGMNGGVKWKIKTLCFRNAPWHVLLMEKIVYFPSYFALPLFFFWWWFVVCCIDGPTLLFPTWSSCWLAESHCRTLGVGNIISSGLGEPQSGMEILSVWGKGDFFYYYFPFSFKGQLSSGGDSSISLPLDAHVGTFSLLLKLLQPKSEGLFLRNPNKQ